MIAGFFSRPHCCFFLYPNQGIFFYIAVSDSFRSRFRISSERLEKPGIEPTTPGLEGEQLNHYATEVSVICNVRAYMYMCVRHFHFSMLKIKSNDFNMNQQVHPACVPSDVCLSVHRYLQVECNIRVRVWTAYIIELVAYGRSSQNSPLPVRTEHRYITWKHKSEPVI